jgi:hypothetical protein
MDLQMGCSLRNWTPRYVDFTYSVSAVSSGMSYRGPVRPYDSRDRSIIPVLNPFPVSHKGDTTEFD